MEHRSSKNDYERRARLLLQHLSTHRTHWEATIASLTTISTYPAVRQLSTELTHWKKSEKREWVKERGELRDLLGNIRTKLRTYGMRNWEPEVGLGLDVRLNFFFESISAEWKLNSSSVSFFFGGVVR